MFSVTGIPWSRITDLKTSLSMQSADASTPAPTYGTPASSSSPCTVPSSPNGPCSTGKTTSTSASVVAHLARRQALGQPANLFGAGRAREVRRVPSCQRPERSICTATTSLPLALERVDHARGGGDARSRSRSSGRRGSRRSGGSRGRRRGGRGRRRVPSPPGVAVELADVDDHDLAGLRVGPGCRVLAMTMPSWLGSVTGSCDRRATVRPACCRIVVASRLGLARHVGDLRRRRPLRDRERDLRALRDARAGRRVLRRRRRPPAWSDWTSTRVDDEALALERRLARSRTAARSRPAPAPASRRARR